MGTDTVRKGGWGGWKNRAGREGGVRQTKKLHVSTWCWQLMRCTIIIFNWWSTLLWQRAVGNDSSSSALMSIYLGPRVQQMKLRPYRLDNHDTRGRNLRKFWVRLLSALPQHLLPLFFLTEGFSNTYVLRFNHIVNTNKRRAFLSPYVAFIKAWNKDLFKMYLDESPQVQILRLIFSLPFLRQGESGR